MKDLPDSSWINWWPSYQNTNHREQAIFDIHASAKDREVMEAGWFVPHLPDLNLRNPITRYLPDSAGDLDDANISTRWMAGGYL